MSAMEFGDLAPVALGADEFEARTKAAVLQDEGIETFVFPAARLWSGGVGFGATAGGVPVWVRREDLDRARAVVAARLAESVDLDWDQVDVGARQDDVEPGRVNTMPLLARIGLALAAAIIVMGAVAALVYALL